MSLEMINFEILFLLILRAWLLPNTRLHYISSNIVTLDLHFSICLSIFICFFKCQYYPFIIYSTVVVVVVLFLIIYILLYVISLYK